MNETKHAKRSAFHRGDFKAVCLIEETFCNDTTVKVRRYMLRYVGEQKKKIDARSKRVGWAASKIKVDGNICGGRRMRSRPHSNRGVQSKLSRGRLETVA